MHAPRWRHLRSASTQVVLPVLLALLVRSTLVQAYHIPSGSMENTLLVGDFLVAEKLTFGSLLPGKLPGMSRNLPSLRTPAWRQPHPGELVIIEHPEDPAIDLIKRCVAVGGQMVLIRDKQLFVDGEAVALVPDGKHLDGRVLRNARDQFGPYRVPEEHVFLLGDNRDNSVDSRFFGAVPVAKLRARPLAVLLQIDAKRLWRSRIHFKPLL